MLTALSRFVFLDVCVVTAVVAGSIVGLTWFGFPHRDFTLCPILLQNADGRKGFSKTSTNPGDEDLEERSERWVLGT